jgi:nucleotide-binding universal stress UspA family protein
MIQRILCPTNFTANSKTSIAYGMSVAKENGAQLIMFHATAFPKLAYYPVDADGFYQWDQLVPKFKVDHILAEAESKLRNFVRATFEIDSIGVAWKTRVGLGDVAEEIVVAAAQEEVDLIVLARTEKGTLARLFSRSISEAVSNSATCPVLTIDAAQSIRHSRGWRALAFREILQSS